MEDDWVVEEFEYPNDPNDNVREAYKIVYTNIQQYAINNLPEIYNPFSSSVLLTKEPNPDGQDYWEYCSRHAGDMSFDTDECGRSVNLSDKYDFEIFMLSPYGLGDVTTYNIFWNNNI